MSTEKRKNNIIKNWLGLILIFLVWLIIHNIDGYIVANRVNIQNTTANQEYIINNSFKISNPKITSDIFDKYYKVSKVTGTITNISPNLKKHITCKMQLLDNNDVEIEIITVKISSLAPGEEHKFDELVYKDNVKSWKIYSISSK